MVRVMLTEAEFGGLARAMVALDAEIEELTTKSDFPPKLRRECEAAERAFGKIKAEFQRDG